jgi:hypothetical protein
MLAVVPQPLMRYTYPPITKTFSSLTDEHLRFKNLRFAFNVSSSVLTYTAPSRSNTSYFEIGSSAGASSTSPVATLKQAVHHQSQVSIPVLALKHTSVPRARQPSLRREHTLCQRRTIMRAIRTRSMHLILNLQQQHFSTLHALYLNFLLLAILKVQGRNVLELKFLRHVAW